MKYKDRLFTISPYFELFFRYFYWNKYLHKLIIKSIILLKRSSKKEIHSFDINDIFNTLSEYNIQKGSLIILHSSYDILSKTGLSPKEIIEITESFGNKMQELEYSKLTHQGTSCNITKFYIGSITIVGLFIFYRMLVKIK